MSLRELCQANTFTVERQSVTNNDSMSNVKAYSTTNRGRLPRSFKGRHVPLSARERSEYSLRDLQVTGRVYTEECDPQLDERDRLICDEVRENRKAGDNVPKLNVTGERNPDQLSRYWIVEVVETTSSVK